LVGGVVNIEKDEGLRLHLWGRLEKDEIVAD
jgi:hypothetical protein